VEYVSKLEEVAMQDVQLSRAVGQSPMRSILFVPGNRPDRIDKAVQTNADIILVDLADAVPLEQKASTRKIVRKKIASHSERGLFIRINALETGLYQDDIDAVVIPELRGMMLPKVETPEQISKIHQLLLSAENDAGMISGSLTLMVLIESVLGVCNCHFILNRKTLPPRNIVAAFGAANYALDLGIDLSKDGIELIMARTQIAWASRIAELDPPIDTPFMLDLTDTVTLKSDAFRAKQLGYQGKLCIHPSQIEPCNEIFSPTKREINFAKQDEKAFEERIQQGVGAFQVNGKFNDKPAILVESITEALTDAILTGVLKGGDKLLEVELQKKFGTSRSPLREAFLELEKKGLVEKKPRKGTYVKKITRRDITDNFPVRAALEGLAAREAKKNMTAAELDELKRIFHEMTTAAEQNNNVLYWKLHQRFHTIFIDSSRNDLLIGILKNLRMHNLWYYYSYKYYNEDLVNSLETHQKILDLFLTKSDTSHEVETKVREHCEVAMERFLFYREEDNYDDLNENSDYSEDETADSE
jgi:citrate lyase subunit beta/citryl-CoA lyase